MHSSILKKCLDELSKDDFRKDYVIGMLETLVAMIGVEVPQNKETPKAKLSASLPVDDEGAILDAHARVALETIKSMSGQDI